MKSRQIIAVSCFLALLGCGGRSINEIVAEQEAKQDDHFCSSIGLKLGTSQYADCRMQQSALRTQRQNQAAANNAALLAAGTSMVANQPPPPPPAPLPNILPQQTRCQPSGAAVTCTTY